jgi:hypothetical protein
MISAAVRSTNQPVEHPGMTTGSLERSARCFIVASSVNCPANLLCMHDHLERAAPNNELQAPQLQNRGMGNYLSPPQFKLDASRSGLDMEEMAEESSPQQEPEVKNVANVAVITRQIQNWAPEKMTDNVAYSLEALKHDPAQVAHFRKYFQEKVGMSFPDYLKSYFSEQAAIAFDESLDGTKDTYAANEVAEAFHTSLKAGELEDVVVLLSFATDIEAASKAYAELYRGQDLYTDLMAVSSYDYNIAANVNNAFGKWHNYEKVSVKNEEEAIEAGEIIARIYDTYGVDINSQRAMHGVLHGHKDAPPELKKQIQTATWTLENLRDLEATLAKFKDFLGPRPTSFQTYEEPRALDAVGRVNKDVSTDDDDISHISESTAGHASKGGKYIALFDSMDSEGLDKRYQSQQIDPETGKMVNLNQNSGQSNVMTHELGHALLGEQVPAFQKVGGYWVSSEKSVLGRTFVDPKNNYPIAKFKVTNVTGVEAPITDYGGKDSGEDLAETVAMYLNNPSILLNGHPSWHKLPKELKRAGVTGNPCPKRYAFIKKVFDDQAKKKQ